jgi:hypothetical protein
MRVWLLWRPPLAHPRPTSPHPIHPTSKDGLAGCGRFGHNLLSTCSAFAIPHHDGRAETMGTAGIVMFDARSSNTLPGRLELPTLRLTASRSNQLS